MKNFESIVIIGDIKFLYTLLESSHEFSVSEEITHHVEGIINNNAGFDNLPSLKVHALYPYRFFFFQFPLSFVLIKLHESDKLC